MSEHTTAELVSFIGCDSCSDYASCDIKDHCRWKACAERLESQEKEIAELKKQIAETYTAEQFIHDADRIHECKKENEANIDIPMSCKEFVGLVKSWAASHPEKPKVTNGDKLSEVFGTQSFGELDAMFRMIDFTNWLGKEYKEPSDK
jgi:hypothetical protein